MKRRRGLVVDWVKVHATHLSLYLFHFLSDLTFYFLDIAVEQVDLMVQHFEWVLGGPYFVFGA